MTEQKEALRIKRLNPNIPLPAYQTPGSAGLDLCASIGAPMWIQPGCFAHIPTGIAIDCSVAAAKRERSRR